MRFISQVELTWDDPEFYKDIYMDKYHYNISWKFVTFFNMYKKYYLMCIKCYLFSIGNIFNIFNGVVVTYAIKM